MMYKTLDDAIKNIAHANPRKREVVAQFLGQLNDPRRIEYLIKMLHDKDERVREQAAAALAASDDDRAIQPLIDCYIDPERRPQPNVDGEVSQAIALAIMDFGPRAAAKLVPYLADSTDAWQKNIPWLLGEIADPDSVQPLIDAHNATEEGAVRYNIKDAIKTINTGLAQEFLRGLKKRW